SCAPLPVRCRDRLRVRVAAPEEAWQPEAPAVGRVAVAAPEREEARAPARVRVPAPVQAVAPARLALRVRLRPARLPVRWAPARPRWASCHPPITPPVRGWDCWAKQ